MKKEKRVKVVNWFENNFKTLDSLFENVQLLDYLNHKKTIDASLICATQNFSLNIKYTSISLGSLFFDSQIREIQLEVICQRKYLIRNLQITHS